MFKIIVVIICTGISSFSFGHHDIISSKRFICGAPDIIWGGGIIDYQFEDDGSCKTFHYRNDEGLSLSVKGVLTRHPYFNGQEPREITKKIVQNFGLSVPFCERDDEFIQKDGHMYSRSTMTPPLYTTPITEVAGQKVMDNLFGCLSEDQASVATQRFVPKNLKDESVITPELLLGAIGGPYLLLEDGTIISEQEAFNINNSK